MNKQEKINKATLTKIAQDKRVPLLKVIRLKCLECCGFQEAEVRRCLIKDCILYRFRLGKHPVPKKMSEKQLKALRRGRENKN